MPPKIKYLWSNFYFLPLQQYLTVKKVDWIEMDFPFQIVEDPRKLFRDEENVIWDFIIRYFYQYKLYLSNFQYHEDNISWNTELI